MKTFRLLTALILGVLLQSEVSFAQAEDIQRLQQYAGGRYYELYRQNIEAIKADKAPYTPVMDGQYAKSIRVLRTEWLALEAALNALAESQDASAVESFKTSCFQIRDGLKRKLSGVTLQAPAGTDVNVNVLAYLSEHQVVQGSSRTYEAGAALVEVLSHFGDAAC